MNQKDMIFISVAPDDTYFWWQYKVFLTNLDALGYKNEIHILLFVPKNRLGQRNSRFLELEEQYKGTNIKFFWYEDTENLLETIQRIQYIPLLRPHCLRRHFEAYPELSSKAFFYHDSDICFTKYLDFEPFLREDDPVCYLSDTRSYISSEYFDSKKKDVLPHMLEAYEKIDILGELSKLFGISRKICEENKDGSGGAQYLLKGIDANYWADVEKGCIIIRSSLYHAIGGLNRIFFETEEKGFQSWCCDMWSVLWNLWRRGIKTECPKELDFAWATDPIEKWDKVYLYHDAGASTREVEPGHKLFNKRELPYVNNQRTPLDDDLSFVSPKYCSHNYTKWIMFTSLDGKTISFNPI